MRQPDLVTDNVTLPLQRLREAVSEMIKTSEDSETGQELMECNRRLIDLKEAVGTFLSQAADHHVYWVERAGKMQRNISLNAAPVVNLFRQTCEPISVDGTRTEYRLLPDAGAAGGAAARQVRP